ncbi:hypothetical protein Pelo_1145 [Pelomyxa schiedti]|nr:hypothetical protein Pelo_1145 [Pelomyxa schiedti]
MYPFEYDVTGMGMGMGMGIADQSNMVPMVGVGYEGLVSAQANDMQQAILDHQRMLHDQNLMLAMQNQQLQQNGMQIAQQQQALFMQQQQQQQHQNQQSGMQIAQQQHVMFMQQQQQQQQQHSEMQMQQMRIMHQQQQQQLEIEQRQQMQQMTAMHQQQQQQQIINMTGQTFGSGPYLQQQQPPILVTQIITPVTPMTQITPVTQITTPVQPTPVVATVVLPVATQVQPAYVPLYPNPSVAVPMAVPLVIPVQPQVQHISGQVPQGINLTNQIPSVNNNATPRAIQPTPQQQPVQHITPLAQLTRQQQPPQQQTQQPSVVQPTPLQTAPTQTQTSTNILPNLPAPPSTSPSQPPSKPPSTAWKTHRPAQRQSLNIVSDGLNNIMGLMSGGVGGVVGGIVGTSGRTVEEAIASGSDSIVALASASSSIVGKRISCSVDIHNVSQDEDPLISLINSVSALPLVNGYAELRLYHRVIQKSIHLVSSSCVEPQNKFPYGFNVSPPFIKPDILQVREFENSVMKVPKNDHRIRFAAVAAGYTQLTPDVSTLLPCLSSTWRTHGIEHVQTVTSWKFTQNPDGSWSCASGQGAIGTSHRKMNTTEKASQLVNCYSTIFQNNQQFLIRTGIIDTITKLRQFESVLLKLNTTRSNSQVLRVSSISLVYTMAISNETHMAKNQHSLLTSHDWKSSKIELLHMNLQINKTDFLGIRMGESESRSMNEGGLRQYSVWLGEQARKTGVLEPSSLIYSVLTTAMDTAAVSLNELVGTLEKLSGFLVTEAEHKNILVSASLLSFLISSLCLTPKGNRFQQIMSILALNYTLGVTTAVNCKSGCDRTGIMFAMASAVFTMLETRRNLPRLAELIENYDDMRLPSFITSAPPQTNPSAVVVQPSTVPKSQPMATTVTGYSLYGSGAASSNFEPIAVPRIYPNLGGDFTTSTPPLPASSPSPNNLTIPTCTMDEYDTWLSSISSSELMLLMLEFRNCFFYNLMEVSWPVTALSTGVPGFKIGKSGTLMANPLLPQLVPPMACIRNCPAQSSPPTNTTPTSSPPPSATATTKVIPMIELWDMLVGAAGLRGGPSITPTVSQQTTVKMWLQAQHNMMQQQAAMATNTNITTTPSTTFTVASHRQHHL